MKFEYCAAIRTLGTAGDKYYQTLLSLKQQTIPPKKILVYIAEGYPLPKETIGIEQYVYVKKGMIAQRALPYKEVDTEYILLLDDDLYLAPDAVERMYNGMTNNSGDVMCANVFPNHEASFSEKLRWIFFVGTFPMKSNKWAFKIRKNGNYSYNNDPKNGIYESQSAAGLCSLWKLDVFKSVHFEDEAYFDKFRYPIGEDQLLFNKAYQRGWKVLVDYNLPVQHLDAGSGHVKAVEERVIENIAILFLIWHRTCLQSYGKICIPSYIRRILATIIIPAVLHFLKRGNVEILRWQIRGLKKGIVMSKSEEYKSLPPFADK